MGPNLNSEQITLLNDFITVWDSTIFNTESKQQIIIISSQLASKRMRPSPHFVNYLNTIMSFIKYDVDNNNFITWLKGLNKISAKQLTRLSDLNSFITSSGLLITKNLLYESGSSIWKTTNNRYTFECDSVFKIVLGQTTLICYSQNDSTMIENTSGIYVPETRILYGEGGKITWVKAGYNPDDVFAELANYELNISHSFFKADSARFTHYIYFPHGVTGKISDRTIKINNPATATYPRFETYRKKFLIEDIYENVDFEGGLAFEGAKVRGTGDNHNPSRITMYRNDTLYINARSISFLFDSESIKSQSTAFTLYLDEDSIYHSDIAFSYNVQNGELNTYRSRSPTSRSPYYSSYHKMDMYFEYLSWKLKESKITLSRARGASMGQAYFESVSFYNANEFHRLMGLDEYHPLYRLKQFSEWWYSETFSIDEFAKWIRQSGEYATGLCIDLANKGFLYFDRANDEVTIKQKLHDYINSFAKKQDYDVISFLSETSSSIDNAVLDMHNYKIKINGIPRIFLSDSQKVAIFPYDKSITLEKNRSFEFNGVVQAGMITIFGNDFKFSYDTFKINLVNVDSIMLAVETDERDEYGGILSRSIEDLIQMTRAELLIDDPNNKSGLMSLEQYPIFSAISDSYVFYDKIKGLEGIYPADQFYFRLEPFVFENTDRLQESDLNLKGEFFAGNILPPMSQIATIQNDKSLGFYYETPDDGLNIYGGKGRFYNSITMSNAGLKGSGSLNYLTAIATSDEFSMYPDSVIAMANQFSMTSSTLNPEVASENTLIKWYPGEEKWYADPGENIDFDMFDNGTSLDGKLLLSKTGLTGSGIINLTDSRIVANDFSFEEKTIQADSANYNLKSISGDGYAFIAEDANTFIDFENQISRFTLNTDSSLVMFPEVNYICTMTDFEYEMNSRILSMSQRGRESTTLMPPDELLKQDLNNIEEPTFFSTHMRNDTISFTASHGRYILSEEKVIAENVNYIKIADAFIQPDSGILKINKGARMDPLNESIIAINNRHIIHSAKVDIIRSTRYIASGIYDWIDENNEIQPIRFNEILVDSLKSKGTGHVRQIDKFMLSPDFSFLGDVHFHADNDNLNFLGSSGIVHSCENIGSAPIRFNSDIDPLNIMIPVDEKARDINGNLITAGTYIAVDSTHLYSAFLSHGKSWADVPLVPASGWLIYDKGAGKYKIASKEKLANTTLGGNLVTFDCNFCDLYSEGLVNTGVNFGLVKLKSAGNVSHITDSGLVEINLIMAFNFHFSEPGLSIMADEIRFIPTLEAVDISTEGYNKRMEDLLGRQAAGLLREELNLYGVARSFPKDFKPELVLNDVTLVWNDEYRSYRSIGKIGIGFIGKQSINVKVDGYIEMQKRRSGDMLDIYLKVDDSTWYWFSYTRGVMMTLSGNNNYNSIIREEKQNDRKHPDNTIRQPYSYMIGVQDRLERFLRRMTEISSDIGEEDSFEF